MQKKTSSSSNKEAALHRWEIVLLTILSPIIYLVLCFIVLHTEYNYPHRNLINLFDSELMPFVVILGFDVAWLIALCFLPFGSKRTKIYLTLLIFVLSAVAITDIYIINMWHHAMA